MSPIAAAVSEMLAVWNQIEAAARQQFPNASEEQIFQIVSGAMRAQLKGEVKS